MCKDYVHSRICCVEDKWHCRLNVSYFFNFPCICSTNQCTQSNFFFCNHPGIFLGIAFALLNYYYYYIIIIIIFISIFAETDPVAFSVYKWKVDVCSWNVMKKSRTCGNWSQFRQARRHKFPLHFRLSHLLLVSAVNMSYSPTGRWIRPPFV